MCTHPNLLVCVCVKVAIASIDGDISQYIYYVPPYTDLVGLGVLWHIMLLLYEIGHT